MKYLLIAWVGGALITTPLWCLLSGFRKEFFGSTSPQRKTSQRVRAFAVAMLPLFLRDLVLWPFVLNQALQFGLPPILVKMGLRPAWTELSECERDRETWTAHDGRDFYASVFGMKAREPARISAEWPVGSVAFRFRRLAPTNSELSDWQTMNRMSLDDWSQIIETEEELHEPRPFETDITLQRGKYLVEFRAETEDGQFEEFSGLTLIVT